MKTDGSGRPLQRSPLRLASDLAFHLQNARKSAAALERQLGDGDPDRVVARQIKEMCAACKRSALLAERRLTR